MTVTESIFLIYLDELRLIILPIEHPFYFAFLTEMTSQLRWLVDTDGIVPGTIFQCGEKWIWNFRRLKSNR
jgi:hypothetical protein